MGLGGAADGEGRFLATDFLGQLEIANLEISGVFLRTYCTWLAERQIPLEAVGRASGFQEAQRFSHGSCASRVPWRRGHKLRVERAQR